MIDFHKNEKKNVWIEISSRNTEEFSIVSATFEVLDETGKSVQASGPSTIAAYKIYGLVDTTTEKFVAGESYQVIFSFVIGLETYMYRVPIKLAEIRL